MTHELPRDIVIHGIFSTRKTTRALTASKDYPAVPADAPFKELVKITDCAIISWDSQGTLTLPHLGIDLAAEQVFNTVGRMIPKVPSKDDPTDFEPESILTTINESRKWAIQLAKRGVRFFIHDTISTKDTRNVGYWTKLLDDTNANDKAGQKLYRNVLNTHRSELEWWQNFAGYYNTYNIWLCHTTIKGQDAPSDDPRAKAAAELQRKAKGLLGAELAARITGQSWNYYYENTRLVYYQTVEQDGGKQVAKWTTRSKEVAVKPCFPAHIVPDVMNADFRELFARIQGTK